MKLVPLRQLKRIAIYYIKNKPSKHKPTLMQSLTNYSWVRWLVSLLLRYSLAKRVFENALSGTLCCD